MRTQAPLATEVRRILSLAWPVILTSLNWTILHVTDVAIVGLAGTNEAAALGASRSLTFPGIVVGVGALTGVLVFTSRADGARDLRETGRILHHGLLLAVSIGMLSWAALFFFADPLLHALGVAEAILPATARVVQAMALAYPSQLLILAASFFLEGVSRPARVTVVNLATLPINAVLAWVLATGHFGMPALGAVGAALATAIASAIGAFGMLIAAWTLPRAQERGVHALSQMLSRESLRGAGRLARFGAVPAIAAALELIGFSILIALSTQLGPMSAHAFQIVFSIHNVTFAVALGLGSAAGVRVGNALGEEVPEQGTSRALVALVLAILATGLLSLLLMLFAADVVGLFPAVPQVHTLAAAMLLVWAPFILFDGAQVVLLYALRSFGDQVAAGVNGIIAFFLVTGGLGWALVHLGYGPNGLAIASGAGMIVAALLHGARLYWVSRRFRSQS